ncbi:MAG: BBP7 family outer membrane beta-barrel protein [Planctomycetota bacterium]|nr:BBP7 family outer membrane beta-barrel protein [Planctomycetota bacterium]
MKPHRTLLGLVALALAHAAPAYADQNSKPSVVQASAAQVVSSPEEGFQDAIGDVPVNIPASCHTQVAEADPPCESECIPRCTGSSRCERSVYANGLLWDPWVTLEYMHTWRKARPLPALVTTSPPSVDGVLPDAAILFGGDVGGHLRAAGELSLGAWLDDSHVWGIGGAFFIAELDSTVFGIASNANGFPVLARPFFNTNPSVNRQDTLVVTSPGVRSGSIQAREFNDLSTAEAYARYLLYACGGRRLDLIAGYEFARIDNGLSINNSMTQISGGYPPGTQFTFQDVFEVHNHFDGAALGLLAEADAGPFTFSLLGKLGLGNMHETLSINGSSSITIPGQANSPPAAGGLLTQPSNIGNYTSDQFCLAPSAEIKAIYHLTHRLDFSLGYSFTYWNHLAMAADQIDVSAAGTPTTNASQLLGGTPTAPANPAFNGIRDTTFWVQGMTFGLTLKM